jgi:hypothetical protein
MSRGVRGGTGLVRIGRRARFFGSPREGFPILGIVDRDAEVQSRSVSFARKIRRDFLGDRVAHSDVPHLPAGPPSRKAPRLRTGTPRRRSGLRLRRNGPTRPCPSSRSWRSARRSRAEPSRRRVSDPAESEERAKRRTTLAAVRVCAALRTVTARQTLPKIFRRRSLLPSGKLGGSFAVSLGRPVVSFGYDNGARSRLVITSFAARGANACPRRLAVAATRPCASTRPRRYVPSLRRRTRATLPSPDRRAKPVVPKSGDADRARPVQKAASCGPRGTDRDEACFPRARLPLRPPRDTSTDAAASRPPRASSVPRDAR